jgi:hypothetical protein
MAAGLRQVDVCGRERYSIACRCVSLPVRSIRQKRPRLRVKICRSAVVGCRRSIRDERTTSAKPKSATIAAIPIVKMISPIILHSTHGMPDGSLCSEERRLLELGHKYRGPQPPSPTILSMAWAAGYADKMKLRSWPRSKIGLLRIVTTVQRTTDL